MPLAVGGLLVVTLIVQLARPDAAPAPKPAAIQQRPVAARAVAPIADYPQILARPLFNPARGASGVAAAGDAASTNLGDYTLVGVASVGGRGEAVLRGPGGQVIDLKAGEALLGWRVAEIGTAGVVLEQGDARRTVAVGAVAAPKTGAP